MTRTTRIWRNNKEDETQEEEDEKGGKTKEIKKF